MMSPAEVRALYESGLSAQQVASMTNHSESWARRIIVAAGGVMRSRKDAVRRYHASQDPCPVFESDVTAYLDGLLASDGHLARRHDALVRYSHPSICLAWLEEMQSYLKMAGLVSDIRPEFVKGRQKKWRLTTRSCGALVPFYERWYRDLKKVVPSDLRMDGHLLRNWYLGDGSACRSGAYLYTEGFAREDVTCLQQRLASVGISATHTKNNNLYIGASSRVLFLKQVLAAGDVPAGMEHKFPAKE